MSMRIQRLEYSEPTASSARAVVGVKATSARRASNFLHENSAWRDLDAADRTRTRTRVAAPEIVAQAHGSPEIELRRQRALVRDRCHALELRRAARVLQCSHAVMQKDFDRWNKVKKSINAADENVRLYFHTGDIWWVHLGVNVGYEIDGKHRDYSRPVIVLKKYNQYSFLALPLTTNPAPNKWRVPVGFVDGEQAFAVLSQLRNLDSHRLIEKKGHLPPDVLAAIKKEASRMNFG